MIEQLSLLFEKVNPKEYSPLTLAYIGDAVFEIYVRMFISTKEKVSVDMLHREVTKHVNATAQSDKVKKIIPLLSEEEMSVFKRGRNAKVYHTPKNSSNADYHYATGFETLIGYLFIKGDVVRLVELLEKT